MGIGNTTASSALAAVFTGAPPEEVTGRGTGIDDATFRRKVDVVRRGLAGQPARSGGRRRRAGEGRRLRDRRAWRASCSAPPPRACRSSSTASSPASPRWPPSRLAPPAAGYLIASHRSVEAGHRLVLQALGAKPLLDLDLRLGEGTGAALAMPLVDAALAIAAEMATFESAGVSDGPQLPWRTKRRGRGRLLEARVTAPCGRRADALDRADDAVLHREHRRPGARRDADLLVGVRPGAGRPCARRCSSLLRDLLVGQAARHQPQHLDLAVGQAARVAAVAAARAARARRGGRPSPAPRARRRDPAAPSPPRSPASPRSPRARDRPPVRPRLAHRLVHVRRREQPRARRQRRRRAAGADSRCRPAARGRARPARPAARAAAAAPGSAPCIRRASAPSPIRRRSAALPSPTRPPTRPPARRRGRSRRAAPPRPPRAPAQPLGRARRQLRHAGRMPARVRRLQIRERAHRLQRAVDRRRRRRSPARPGSAAIAASHTDGTSSAASSSGAPARAASASVGSSALPRARRQHRGRRVGAARALERLRVVRHLHQAHRQRDRVCPSSCAGIPLPSQRSNE